MKDPVTGYTMPRNPSQTTISFDPVVTVTRENEVNENPDKYFTTENKDSQKMVLTLEKAARSCINQAEKINTEVSGNWTRRRQAQADSNAKKKDRLMKWAKILNTLAIMWDANEVPPLMRKIKSASDLEFVFYHGYPNPPERDHPIDGWYSKEYPAKLAKALKLGIRNKSDGDELGFGLNQLGEEKLTPEQEKERLLKEKMKAIRSYNIPGFFPTPDDLIDKMIQYARLEDHHYLLEPSAGIGNILDRVRFHGIKCYIDAVEIRPALEEVLRIKGYNSSCEDIMDTTEIRGRKWDRILMNPPFENGQDIEHVRHCFDTFLAVDGILVSVMSSGVKTNTYAKYIDFRNWVEEMGGFFEDNGQAFKNAFNSTGVSSVILVITK